MVPPLVKPPRDKSRGFPNNEKGETSPKLASPFPPKAGLRLFEASIPAINRGAFWRRRVKIKRKKACPSAGFVFLVFTFNCLVFTFNCFADAKDYVVRVAIMQDVESLTFKIRGAYEIIDSKDKKVLYQGKNLKTTVTACKEGILLGATKVTVCKIIIVARATGAIIVNNRRFKGNIELIKKDDSHFLAVNHIDLEDYIRGILYHEASHYWPMEALKAQAIASRTYAIYHTQENKDKSYDVTSDTSQIYGGSASERYRTNQAVDETVGRILTYQGRPIPAYFHTVCAGRTEDASLLWNIDIAPLKGVVCGFCKESPRYSWHYVLSTGEIREKLAKAGNKLGKIADIAIGGRDSSGRITDLIIKTLEKEAKIPSKDFRLIIGPDNIRSTNFSVKIINGDAVFEGFGWGHGVGMCQWGAYFMAKQGYSSEAILQYYFPETKLEIVSF